MRPVVILESAAVRCLSSVTSLPDPIPPFVASSGS